MLKQQLREELKQSMLARDAARTSTLRMLISALGYYEILSVIQKEAKQHKDSIQQFKDAGRDELVAKEEAELKILEAYLPEQMGEEEIRKLVIEAVAQTGASSPSDMGKVMGALMPKTKGKADGGLVSKVVREELAK